MCKLRLYMVLYASLLLMLSCASTVRTKVNTFRLDGAELGHGSIKVVPADETQPPTLEYSFYASHLRSALQSLGYSVAEVDQDSEYVAFLNYSVDESDSEISPFHSNLYAVSRVGASVGFGTSGLLVVDDGPRRAVYDRTFQLVIAKSSPTRQRVYEVTGTSRGNCGTLSEVFDEMLQAMLTGFPAHNGSLSTHSVRGNVNCQ